jgi:hypothetical protein
MKLRTIFHNDVPSENKRTVMAQDGTLASFLEQYRGHVEEEGFDAAVAAIVAEEELVPALKNRSVRGRDADAPPPAESGDPVLH